MFKPEAGEIVGSALLSPEHVIPSVGRVDMAAVVLLRIRVPTRIFKRSAEGNTFS